MKFTVNNRWSGDVQFDAEIECDEATSVSIKIGLAVKWAIKSGAYLRSADLRSAYLRSADLRSADLRSAYLRSADLRSAYLRSADLRGADLRGADLRSADLSGADLSGADLSGAYLRSADLRSADLRSADLRSAYLSGAYLSGQWVVQGATRSDGYQFLLTSFTGEGVRLRAGCRNFTISEARDHWTRTRGGTPLGNETFAIIDGMLALARIRGLNIEAKIPAAA